MGKASVALSRGRGRPKANDTDLVIDVWVEWLRTGGLHGGGLDRAIRAVAATRAKQAKQERKRGQTEKPWRERARAGLKEADGNEMLFRAMVAAQQRGVTVPEYLRPLLHARQSLDPYVRREVDAGAEGDRIRRLVAFHRSIDDIVPPDTPISTVDQLFTDYRKSLIRRWLRK